MCQSLSKDNQQASEATVAAGFKPRKVRKDWCVNK